jgi:hypothetical protein
MKSKVLAIRLKPEHDAMLQQLVRPYRAKSDLVYEAILMFLSQPSIQAELKEKQI